MCPRKKAKHTMERIKYFAPAIERGLPRTEYKMLMDYLVSSVQELARTSEQTASAISLSVSVRPSIISNSWKREGVQFVPADVLFTPRNT